MRYKKKTLDFIETFPDGKIPLKDTTDVKGMKYLLLSVDTEYQTGIHGATTNTILCYSYAVYNDFNKKYATGIIYTDYTKAERKKIEDVIIEAALSVGIKGISLNGYKILFIAHFLVAEFCSFVYEKRNKLLTNLDIISKTLISNKFNQYRFNNQSRNKIIVEIRFCDTMLLLPDSFRSLKKASQFVTNQKIELEDGQIANMLWLLLDNKELFEKYAIYDAKITLDLFIKLIVYLNKLNGTTSDIFSTLASASVRKYKRHITTVFKEKTHDIKLLFPSREPFSDGILEEYKSLAVRSYMGGLNNAYLIGDSKDDNAIYLDIDLSSCYPVAMSLLYMYEPKKCKIKDIKKAVKEFDGTFLKIGCAEVSFSFPKDCLYPNLSVRDEKYGLVQPLNGRTVATIPEINLALKLHAKIEFHDGFVFESMENDEVLLPIFKNHISYHIKQRDEAKKEGDELLQQLLKTYNNSLYGKLAQGISDKKTYDIRNGYSKKLAPSSISNPYLATMITGFIRAVLSSIIIAINELKQHGLNYEVISATTDGVLYKSPLNDISCIINNDVLSQKYNNNLADAFELGSNDFLKPFEDVDSTLYEKLLEFPSIRLFKKAKESLNV